jgi:hypothetical protein
LEMGGEPTQQLWFREVPLWEQEPGPWWEEVPALMPLYPLCRHGRRPRQAIEYAAGVIEQRVAGEMERADTLGLLDIFGELAYPRLDVGAIIGREKMRESRFGREMRQEGQLEATRKAILLVLRGRFGPEGMDEVANCLTGLDDPEQLERLVTHAATCPDLRQFLAGVPRQAAGR